MSVAVARATRSRGQIAKYLRDGGYDVFECEELANATRFVGVVLVDDRKHERQVLASTVGAQIHLSH